METLFDKYITQLADNISELFSDELSSNVYESKISQTEIDNLVSQLVEYFTVQDPQTLTRLNRNLISKEEFLNIAENWLRKRGTREAVIPNIIEALRRYMWGYYILEDLLNDDEVSDIKVLSPDNIQIKRLGERMSTDLHFKDVDDYKRFVNIVATKNQINISDVNALQNFTDRKNNVNNILRFNISTEFVNSVEWPYLQIRKIPKDKRGMTALCQAGMMDENTAQYLIDRAKTSSGIIFCGKGASGKTTLMNALIEHIPHNKAGLCVQENEELFSDKHPNIMFQHVVSTSGEGKIEYDLQDLARNGLLLDLDYYIIGEIKGNEALYFLNACLTGHQAWCSVHGNSSTEAIYKLADYIKYASDYSQANVLKMLCSIGTVVFMKNFKVAEISEIVGWDNQAEDIKYRRILKREDI